MQSGYIEEDIEMDKWITSERIVEDEDIKIVLKQLSSWLETKDKNGDDYSIDNISVVDYDTYWRGTIIWSHLKDNVD